MVYGHVQACKGMQVTEVDFYFYVLPFSDLTYLLLKFMKHHRRYEVKIKKVGATS